MAVGRSTGSVTRVPMPRRSDPGSNQATDIDLDLSGKPLSPEEVSNLAATLRSTSDLRSLNLASCRLKPEGIRAITLAAASSPTLQTLILDGNVWGDENWEPVTHLLELNTLSQLHIDCETSTDTNIDTEFHAFCTALKGNTGLRQLVLGHQDHELSLSTDQEKWLSDSLAENRSLENFGIHHLNALGADGSRLSIPSGLHRNSGLQTVCIRGFNFNAQDAGVLVGLLNNPNSPVSRLTLYGGWPDRRAASQVMQAAIDNMNLRSFKYSPALTLDDKEKAKALQATLTRNQRLPLAAGNAVHFLCQRSHHKLVEDMVQELRTTFEHNTNGRTLAAVVEAAFNGHEPPPFV